LGSEVVYVPSEWRNRAEFDQWLRNSVASDDANDCLVNYHHQNGIPWPNSSVGTDPAGDPTAAAPYYGTYSLQDINDLHNCLNAGEFSRSIFPRT
jgi:hypothetical protein